MINRYRDHDTYPDVQVYVWGSASPETHGIDMEELGAWWRGPGLGFLVPRGWRGDRNTHKPGPVPVTSTSSEGQGLQLQGSGTGTGRGELAQSPHFVFPSTVPVRLATGSRWW